MKLDWPEIQKRSRMRWSKAEGRAFLIVGLVLNGLLYLRCGVGIFRRAVYGPGTSWCFRWGVGQGGGLGVAWDAAVPVARIRPRTQMSGLRGRVRFGESSFTCKKLSLP